MRQPVEDFLQLHSLAGAPAQAADRLLLLAKSVPLAGVEHSCKLNAQGLHSNRLMFGNDRDHLSSSPLWAAHRHLRMPTASRAAYEQDLARATHLYLGFEGGPNSLSYRIYLEFPVDLARHARDPSTGAVPPALLAKGYKWDALQGETQAAAVCTHYHWHPRITLGEIAHKARELGARTEPTATLLDAVMDLARQRSNAMDWMYLEANEPGLVRQSFDVNFYSAKLRLRDLAHALSTACEHFGIDKAETARWLAEAGDATLGHVSGGVGRDGQPFLTVYYEVDAKAS